LILRLTKVILVNCTFLSPLFWIRHAYYGTREKNILPSQVWTFQAKPLSACGSRLKPARKTNKNTQRPPTTGICEVWLIGHHSTLFHTAAVLLESHKGEALPHPLGSFGAQRQRTWRQVDQSTLRRFAHRSMAKQSRPIQSGWS